MQSHIHSLLVRSAYKSYHSLALHMPYLALAILLQLSNIKLRMRTTRCMLRLEYAGFARNFCLSLRPLMYLVPIKFIHVNCLISCGCESNVNKQNLWLTSA